MAMADLPMDVEPGDDMFEPSPSPRPRSDMPMEMGMDAAVDREPDPETEAAVADLLSQEFPVEDTGGTAPPVREAVEDLGDDEPMPATPMETGRRQPDPDDADDLPDEALPDVFATTRSKKDIEEDLAGDEDVDFDDVGGGRRRGKGLLITTVVLGVLGGGGAALWWQRDSVTAMFPFLGPAVEAVQAFHFADLRMSGFDIPFLTSQDVGLQARNLVPERMVQNGVEILVVRGTLANVTEQPRKVPPISLVLYDASGGIIQQSESVAPPVESLPPGEAAPFTVRLENPSGAAARFAVKFGDR